MSDSSSDAPRAAIAPSGINHLVIHVRDMEESHRFWTELLGFVQVGELSRPEAKGRKMRFYSADHDGKLNHHDIALVESDNLPPPPAEDWRLDSCTSAINHIAITLPSREAFLQQLKFLQSRGVKFNRRVNHSLYINDPNGYGVELVYEMPRDVWEGDIDAALKHFEGLPTEGAEALEDEADVPVFGR